MHMAGEIDKKDRLALLDSEEDEQIEIERLFIYIDPIVGKHPDRQNIEWINENVPYDFGHNTATADIHKGFMKMVSAYMRVLMHQGSYKHLNKMDKVNNHLLWLEEMIRYLFRIIQIVPEGHAEIGELTKEIRSKLKAIIQEKYEKTNGTKVVADNLNFDRYIDEQIRLIKSNYAHLLDKNIAEGNKTALMYHLIALTENISGLRNKQKINFIAIGADESRVLGNEYKAFKGFFNHQWRKYDYQEGKIRAFNVLKNVKVNDNGTLFNDLKQPPVYKINKKEEVITSNDNKKHFKGYVKDLIKVLRKPFNFKIRVVAWVFSRKLRKMVMGALSFERKEVKKDK